MAQNDIYRGTYIGCMNDGMVREISCYTSGTSSLLCFTNLKGDHSSFKVVPGTEVSEIALRLSTYDLEYIPYGAEGGEMEKQAKERVEQKSKARVAATAAEKDKPLT